MLTKIAASLVGIKLKLALGATLLASIIFLGLYMQHLKDQNKVLRLEKASISKERDDLKGTIKETNRRHDVVEQVTTQVDKIREQNRKQRDKKTTTIDKSVASGKDRPVGKLLKDFFNETE